MNCSKIQITKATDFLDRINHPYNLPQVPGTGNFLLGAYILPYKQIETQETKTKKAKTNNPYKPKTIFTRAEKRGLLFHAC